MADSYLVNHFVTVTSNDSSGNSTSSDSGVLAKGWSIFILIALTMGFGMLARLVLKVAPQEKYHRLRKKVVSYLNSFAGGVFLGACLLHLMVEGQEQMEDYLKIANPDFDYTVFMLLVAGGVVAVMLVEQFMLMCTPSSQHHHHHLDQHHDQHHHHHLDQHHHHHHQHSSSLPVTSAQGLNYGSMENRAFCGDEGNLAFKGENSVNPVPSVCTVVDEATSEVCGHHDLEESLGHTHGVESMENVGGLRAFLLLAALSFHTIFDGMAVGLQTSNGDVWQMLVAVAVHKSLVAFCLALSLFKALWDTRSKFCMAALTFFAMMSPIGIVVGIVVTEANIDVTVRSLVSGILQGLATGTFLYVTFLEILREEFGHCKRSFLKVFVVVLGFGAMAGVKLLDRE